MKTLALIFVVTAAITLFSGCSDKTENMVTDLTEKRIDTLANKATSGDKVALETLMFEAQRGNSEVQYRIGVIYNIGLGVPQDYDLAAQWYLKAADQGHGGAQLKLSTLYFNGQGVPRSKVVSYALTRISATRKFWSDPDEINKSAQFMAENMMTSDEVKAGDELIENMSVPGSFRKSLDKYLSQTSGKRSN